VGNSYADEYQRHQPYVDAAWYHAKKKTLFSTERHSERVQKLRAQFIEEVSKISPDKFVFIDESGFSIKMTRSFARAPKGHRIEGHVPGCWGQNLTLIGAMKMDGPTALMTLPGSTDGNAFTAYVKDILLPQLTTGEVVVMDNLAVHKVTGIRDMIESVGARVLFLPPYHPDLNPIEKMWSKMKTILRGLKARTIQTLEVAIANAIEHIRPKDAEAWFKHCGY